MTVIAGLIAQHYGPSVGGAFLAFPAIFPASATLVEKHEKEKKQRAGIATSGRGREAAALEARGAAMGSVALAVFASAAWKLIPAVNAGVALAVALFLWWDLRSSFGGCAAQAIFGCDGGDLWRVRCRPRRLGVRQIVRN